MQIRLRFLNLVYAGICPKVIGSEVIGPTPCCLANLWILAVKKLKKYYSSSGVSAKIMKTG